MNGLFPSGPRCTAFKFWYDYKGTQRYFWENYLGLRQPRGHVGGRALNEATNWSWIRQPLRHRPPLGLIAWLGGLVYWLIRSCRPMVPDREASERAKRWELLLSEAVWGDAAWRPGRPAPGRFDKSGRKKRAKFLFFKIRCIDFPGLPAFRGFLSEAGRQADPPWLPSW